MLKKRIRFFVIILALICFTITINGCNKQVKIAQVEKDFDVFMNELFVAEVKSDTLTLNYALANPEKYGIVMADTTLGEYSTEYMTKGLSLSENYLIRLNSFDYSLLNSNQQLTFNIVKNYLELDLNFGNYLYYSECLGPTTGVQAQLPILLAEYSFYDRKDIDQYVELLSCVPTYFKDIIRFEREKSKKGLFMSDSVAESIIEQCDAFIKSPEDNYLIECFNEKVSTYKGLTKKEIAFYKKENKEAVLNKVVPAYEMLIDVLLELKGTGTNSSGLYYYPEGQAYYECLVKYKTGSDKSMGEMIKMLEKAIGNGIQDITKLGLTDSSLMDKLLSFTSFPITDPEDILLDLKKDISKDFPKAVPVNCEIKYVHKSLSKYLSPAMYLVPPLDSYKENNIYINGNDKDTLSMIYTTVAHEGYPGHLYQCVYFRHSNPAPIRNVMNFLGYDEGWATYVELYSYHLSGIDENLASVLEANNKVVLCMYARADIGIHYEGWTKDDVVAYITKFIADESVAEPIYYTLLEEPAIYLPYAVGYLEILDLRKKAKNTLGDKFVTKDFNQFLLDIGPAQFGVIDDYLNKWLEMKLQ